MSAPRIAILGAGVAGLACAEALRARGLAPIVFDKGRAVGGRLAHGSAGALAADLGAQYATVRDPAFARAVATWRAAGVVAPWRGRIGALAHGGAAIEDTAAVERVVGIPAMGAIAAALARELDVRASHRVERIARAASGLQLAGTIGDGRTLGPAADDEPSVPLGEVDALVVALPPAQASVLLRDVSPALADATARVAFEPCIALAFAADDAALAALPFDGVFVGRDDDTDRVLAWIARDGSKPGRPAREVYVLHAAGAWSRAHLRDDDGALAAALLADLARVLAIPPVIARARVLRRWVHARAPSPLADGALVDPAARIAVGGDWTAGGRVEGAYLAGRALADRVAAWW